MIPFSRGVPGARTLVALHSRGGASRRSLELLSRLAGRWQVRHARAPEGADLDLAGSIVWVDSPSTLPLLEALRPRGVVFDCNADPDAPDTARLIERCDLLLAAGPTLYRSLHGRHPHLHCVPHAVDAARFAPATLRHDGPQARAAAALQARLPGPRLGCLSAIDERIDLALLEALADAHPAWQIVMAGPRTGIEASRLPRRPNLHWLGAQPAARLPHLLNGWDLALLPFTLDAHNRCFNPIETLEYLAAETPVVGTALRDVVALYGDAVEVAAGHAEFIGRCEEVLSETASRRARREGEMMSMVWTASWQRTADSVHALLARRWPVEVVAEAAEMVEAVPPLATTPALAAVAG